MSDLTNDCKLIIKYMIEKTNEYNSNNYYEEQVYLTANRVNRILFLFQICYTEKYGKLAFEDEFYVWPKGPVISQVYYKYDWLNKNGTDSIQADGLISQEKKEILDYILDYTFKIDTLDLSEIVKKCELWYELYDPNDKLCLEIISNDKILEYCKKQEDSNSIKLRRYFKKI